MKKEDIRTLDEVCRMFRQMEQEGKLTEQQKRLRKEFNSLANTIEDDYEANKMTARKSMARVRAQRKAERMRVQ